MSMYDPNKLLADSQANAILTKGTDTIVLTVTECPEVAAGEQGSWVTGCYITDRDFDIFHIYKIYKRTNMSDANVRFDGLLEYYRSSGYVFANEKWIDYFLGSNLAAEESDHSFTD